MATVQLRAIESFDLPELAPYRTMRRQQEQREQGIFVAEGEKVVRRLLESGLGIVSLLLPPKWLEAYSDLIAKRPEPALEVFVAEKEVLEELTGFSMYQGVLGVGRVPRSLSLDELLSQAPPPRLLMAVDGLSSADNLGGLVRNCVAFGASGIIVGETCCSAYMRRAVRGSMGTIFKLPVIESANLAADLHLAGTRGLRVIAAHPHAEKRILTATDFTADCVIVAGSEGLGISPRVLASCDEAVAIPMQNGVDSLNVGTAGALFLYEAWRQRNSAIAGHPMTAQQNSKPGISP
jgi:tRNA G18 (ribose-2'-O)-methylase SpoU